ncbi:hypothetical protein PISL3812_08394 [Talaromyces islandicus]|uniref:Integral membrane protein n=1 Tax=Talaromyces islandicus TaxID=28573 RepID=A0A0U1M8V4_TALIS|nr:hypothetical protein PISL3812_08394 [Talaromyces islandicus]
MAASLKKLLPSAFLLLSSLTPVLAADTFTFLPTAASSTFPACGLTCTVLTQAQDACVPPQVAVSNDQTYVNCFCNSPTLQGLKTTGTVCYTCVDAASQGLLVAWYNGYCNGGYTSTLTSTSTTTATSTTSAATTAATTTGSATTTGTSVPTSTGDDTSDSSTLSATGQSGKSWISTHWKWIVMVVVLIIGFVALAFAGMWLKKRLDARHPGLYHGDDRAHSSNNNSTRFRSPTAGFAIPTSLRNFSSRNSMSNTAATPNNESMSRNINYQSVPNNIQPPVAPYAQSHGSNRSNPNMSMTSLPNNRTEMWGPHQATAHTRDFGDISPVEDPAYAGNGSRTDLSSVGTRGTPRNSHRLSVNSAANLHRGHEPVSPVSPIE